MRIYRIFPGGRLSCSRSSRVSEAEKFDETLKYEDRELQREIGTNQDSLDRQYREQLREVRQNQGKFRIALLKRYGTKCCVTACNVSEVLEAAAATPEHEGSPKRVLRPAFSTTSAPCEGDDHQWSTLVLVASVRVLSSRNPFISATVYFTPSTSFSLEQAISALNGFQQLLDNFLHRRVSVRIQTARSSIQQLKEEPLDTPLLSSTARLLDQYYTMPQTAAACLAHLHAALPDLTADLYVEPSAGAGAFLAQMPEPRLGIDIAPAATDILKQDFLEWLPPLGTGSIAVIGNPPYGAGGAEAVRFFSHAAKFADTIALILPASFMKASKQKRLDSFFHLVSELPLPDEPFLFEGRFHRVSTVFQIWCRKPYMRAKPTKRAVTHPDFIFVKEVSEADFVMRRVGGHTGKIMSVPAENEALKGFSPESNFFISARGVEPDLLQKRFQALQLDQIRRQSVAAYSVSKSDLVAAYKEAAALVAITKQLKL